MSVAGSQQRTFLHLLARLRPHWRSDRNLPARIQTLLAGNRSFGSRDRRLYRELIYTTLRYLPWIEPLLDANPESAMRMTAWLAADLPATRRLREEIVRDWPPCPTDLVAKSDILSAQISAVKAGAAERDRFEAEDLFPSWFRAHCPEAFAPPELTALQTRAALWLRLQTDDDSPVLDEFAQLGWKWARSHSLGGALQMLDEVDVTKTRAFESGRIEVQDIASQLLLESAAIERGQRWLDACAGAGGKSLQLARLLGPQGRVTAHDIRPAALRELHTRAQRAQLQTVSITESAPTDVYDGVLVDAPCSGSGTWRRAPHLKWTTSPQHVEDAATLQQTLLAKFSRNVKPGGRLLYATCSLSARENADIVHRFLADHPEFAGEPARRNFGAVERGGGLTFLPSLHNSDGFFIAAFRRKA